MLDLVDDGAEDDHVVEALALHKINLFKNNICVQNNIVRRSKHTVNIKSYALQPQTKMHYGQ